MSNRIKIKDKFLDLIICDDFERGMAGVSEMKDSAMLFQFDSYEESSFWMKGCLIPLDILFLKTLAITELYQKAFTIESIHYDCQPCKEGEECQSFFGCGDAVLELPGGYCDENQIDIQTKVSFTQQGEESN